MDSLLALLASRQTPNTGDGDRTIVIIDDGMAECMKFCQVRLDADILVLALDSCLGEKGLQFEMFQPDLIVFLLCTPLREAAPLISHSVRLSGESLRVVVLTTTSADEIESQNGNLGVDGDPYLFLNRELHPSKVTVSYFPLHGVFLSSSQTQSDQVELDTFILSSADARSFAALSLNRLGLWRAVLNTEEGTQLLDSDVGKDLQVAVEEVEVGQIPASVRGQMRSIAHQLAGALIFNLKVDVASSIFASGKSSDAIGHTLQPLLDPLAEQYNDALDVYATVMNPAGMEGAGYDDRPSMTGGQSGVLHAQLRAVAMQWAAQAQAGSSQVESFNRLVPGSLLLVDRWHDLLSPGMARCKDNPLSALNTPRSPETKTKNSTGPPPLWEDVYSLAEAHKATFNISLSVLAAREQALLQLLAVPHVGLGECLPYLLSFLGEGNSQIDSDHSDRKVDPCRGPGCFLSTLLLVALTLHLVGLEPEGQGEAGDGRGPQLTETLPLLVEALVDYLLHRASERELAMLAAHGLLGPHAHMVDSLLASRRGETADRGGSLLSEGMIKLELTQKMELISGAVAELAYRTSYDCSSIATGIVEEEGEPHRYVHAEACLQHLQAERGQGGKKSNKADMVTVRAVSSRERRGEREGDRILRDDPTSGVAAPCLLVALLREVLARRDVGACPSSPLAMMEYIESPMAKLKRAGLGLLSQGLGAFGFGGGSNNNAGASSHPRIGIEAPHPGDSPVIVIFVVGGVVPSELAQVRAAMVEHRRQQPGGPRIIVASNRAISAPELTVDLFHC